MGIFNDTLAPAAARTVRDVFGESIVYRVKGGPTFALAGIFSEIAESTDVDGDVTPRVQGAKFQIEIQAGDLTVTPRAFDKVTIRGRSFEVVDVQTSAWGERVLDLVEVSS